MLGVKLLAASLIAAQPRTTEGVASALQAMRPPPRLTVNEWAERNRVVARGTSPEAGRWRSKPYQAPVLDAISDPRNEAVLFVAASQGGGKTEILLNAIGYFVDADPCPQLIVTANVEMAEALSKDRLAPMIRETPSLAAKIKDPRSRDSGNTIRHKEFAGGHSTLVGSNSPSGLAMRPVRFLGCDEIDRWAQSAGTEGNPRAIAEARTTAFWNAVKLYVTSPGMKKTSESWALWQESDQREWMVPCPDCGHEQRLTWAHVHCEKNELGAYDTRTAVYGCMQCGSAWTDAQRWKASARGRYVAMAPFTGTAGFRLPALAVIGRRLEEIFKKWLRAQGNPEKQKAFDNTVLTEWWEDETDSLPDEVELAKRRESWIEVVGGAQVPRGVAVITLGCDVQKDRLEYEIVGWGRGEESYSLRYDRIYGDPKTNASVLADLDRVLLTSFTLPGGSPIWIRAAGIDTGAWAQVMYKFCEPRLRRPLPDGRSQFVFGLKGRTNEPGRPVWPPTPSDPKNRKRRIAKTNLWIVGVDAAKDQVVGRLGIAPPVDEQGVIVPDFRLPGYCHFPQNRGIGWFEGLLAEHAVTRNKNGRAVRSWEPIEDGVVNEPLDARVYAYAALCGVQSPPFLLDLEREVRRVEALMPAVTAVTSPAAPLARTPVVTQRRRGTRSTGVEA